jgi:hypothetical protein
LIAVVEKRRVELLRGDVLVHRGLEVNRDVLDAIVGAASKKKRVLWAFMKNELGDIQAVCYDETNVIWMTPDDVVQPEEVEL